MAKYLPGSEAGDAAYLTGFGWAFMMRQVLAPVRQRFLT